MYLDNAATTPLLPEVKEEIIKYLDLFGNPSSKHEEGYLVKGKIEIVRNTVADIFNGNSRRVIFTSSGSAANNLVIHGLNDNFIFYYSPSSHKSMWLSCINKIYNKEIQLNENGLIDLDWLRTELENEEKRVVLCYEMANSELGIYQNAKDIYELVHSFDGLVVADLTAYLPHYPIHTSVDQADFYTFSAHKIGALKGIGVVYCNSFEQLKPLIYGSQENGYFGGTENVIGIISLGVALNHITDRWNNRFEKQSRNFQDLLEEKISDCYVVLEDCPQRIPHIMTVCFKGILGAELVHLMNEDGYYISTGSACNSGSLEPSRALTAIHLCDDDIPCCVRISFSGEESQEDIDNLIDELEKKVFILRTLG